MTDKLPTLEPEGVYHIYSHAVRNSNLFNNLPDYTRFINKYKEYISPIAQTYSYCLMPNHLHFIVKLKSETELKTFYRAKSRKIVVENGSDSDITPEQLKQLNSKQFANLFSSYTQSTNRISQKKGGLFERPFKRKRIFDRPYFKRLIIYTHRNPIHLGFCSSFEDWSHSSWWSLVFDHAETWLQRATVFNVFESKQGFLTQHYEHLDNFNDLMLFDE